MSGKYLTMLAEGTPWEPLAVPVRCPSASELATRFAEVQDWSGVWDRVDQTLMRVERKRIGGRAIGSNQLPCRVWIDRFPQLCALLATSTSARRFSTLLECTRRSHPRLVPWIASHPMKVLELADRWDKLLGTVSWIDTNHTPSLYLRQVDVPGVDTKFIEGHRGVLSELLDHQLAPERIELTVPRSDFATRYGFLRKPEYLRFRLLNGRTVAGFAELTVRAAEFTTAPTGVSTVYVVENEITYLAFPPVPDAMVVLGDGYAVSKLGALAWLNDVDVIYWGDIDTHGLAILNRLRHRFPNARSMLMDRDVLLNHADQWVAEPTPTTGQLDRLTPSEAALYLDLIENKHGPAVRLEQERVRFSYVEEAVAGYRDRPTPDHSVGWHRSSG